MGLGASDDDVKAAFAVQRGLWHTDKSVARMNTMKEHIRIRPWVGARQVLDARLRVGVCLRLRPGVALPGLDVHCIVLYCA